MLRGQPESWVFVEAFVDGASDQEEPGEGPVMVIELSGGIKAVISKLASPSLAVAALRALRSFWFRPECVFGWRRGTRT
jgi:hypothetical protein